MEEGFLVASADTIPFGWIPYRRFPSSDLGDAWANLGRCGGSKRMILATICLWTKQERLSWYARRTDHEGDMPGPVRVKSFRPDGTIMMCATQLYDNRTMLPVALLCLFDEQRRMHQARRLVAQVPAIVPLGCMVDGLFYAGPPEAKLALREVCDKHKYLHTTSNVFQFKDAYWRRVPSCQQRRDENRHCDIQPLVDHLAENSGNLLPEFREWLDVNGYGHLDDFQAHAVLAAICNHGCMILGAASTGKSEVLRATRDYLKAYGQPAWVCAYTHSATRLVGSETVAHLLHLNTQLADTWFLVDEVGLLPLSTLGAMSRWKALGAKFISFEGYQGQFEPFRDR